MHTTLPLVPASAALLLLLPPSGAALLLQGSATGTSFAKGARSEGRMRMSGVQGRLRCSPKVASSMAPNGGGYSGA